MIDGGTPRSVVVVGGGLVGTCTAYYLRENGYRVTVLEEGNAPASATSFANAGRFCPTRICSYPLASPSALRGLAGLPFTYVKDTIWPEKHDDEHSKLQATADVPGTVQLDLGMIEWGIWFLRNCTPGRFAHNNLVLKQLVHVSQQATEDLLNKIGKENVDYKADNVWVYGDEKELAHAQELAQVAAVSGFSNWKTLDCRECQKEYPALDKFLSRVLGAGMKPSCLVAGDDYSVDARKFTEQVARLAQLPKDNIPPVKFLYNARVTGFVDKNGSRVTAGQISGATFQQARPSLRVEASGATQTPEEERYYQEQLAEDRVVTADHVVVCCGPFTRQVLRDSVGRKVQLQAMKGGSVELYGVKNGPSVSIADYLCGPLNFQATPFGKNNDNLRLIGFADICSLDNVSQDTSGEPLKRVAMDATYESRLVSRAKVVFPDMTWQSQRQPWAGLRPLTPDGLPIMGLLGGFDNLWLNVGHGSIGWTLAASTGVLLTRDILAKDGLLKSGTYVEKLTTRFGLTSTEAMSNSRFSLASFFFPPNVKQQGASF